MVFPIESEDRTMRSLLQICKENARLLIESFRRTLALMDSAFGGQPASGDPLKEMQGINAEVSRNQGALLKELNEVGSILQSRDNMYRLANSFGDSIDSMNALNVRLAEIKSRGWKVGKKEADGLSKMGDTAFNAYIKLRDSLTSLGFNSEKAVNFALEVDELERTLDTLYVEVDLDIIMSGGDLPVVLVLRDVATELEGLVNKAREGADLVRIIGL